MYIRSLYIESFAGITNKGLDLARGLNVIEGANESGKSTVCMFIKFMLYGLSGRGSDGEMSERQKYIPWNTGRAAGTLVIANAKGEYKITRELCVFDDSQPKERLEVIDCDSGERVFRGKVPGVCILGIDEQMFVNTVFVRQIGGTRVDGAGMTEAIENILLSGDENLSLKRAVDRLEKARKAIMPKKGGGGRMPLLVQEEARLAGQLETARAGNAAVISYENESSRLSSLIKQRTAEKEKYTAVCEAYERLERGRRAEKARELLGRKQEIKTSLTEIERYGAISEKSGRINSLSARLSGIISRLKGLRRAMGDAPDPRDSMTAEEILMTRRSLAEAKKLTGGFRLFLVLGITFIVLGAAAAFLFTYLAAIALPGVAFLVMAFVKKTKRSKIYKKWSVKDDTALEEEIDGAIERAKEYDRAAAEWSRREAELYEVEREREDVLTALRASCLVFAKGDEADTDILVARALEEAAQLSRKKEELSSSYAMIKGELLGYMDVLGSDEGESVIESAAAVLETEAGRIAADFTPKDAAMAKNKKNFAEGALPGLLSQKGEADSNLARARATSLDAAVIAVQLEGTRQEIRALKKRLAAIEEAKDALARAGEGLRSSLVPRVVDEASRLMEGFTLGKYDSLSVDRSFSLEFMQDGVKREVGYLSAGTADAAYVSLRCALARVLFSGDVPPMVYDESFARIDEARLLEILSMLSRDDMQSLVFTCRALEGDMAKKLSGAGLIKL